VLLPALQLSGRPKVAAARCRVTAQHLEEAAEGLIGSVVARCGGLDLAFVNVTRRNPGPDRRPSGVYDGFSSSAATQKKASHGGEGILEVFETGRALREVVL
jgi:hypothetical protein